MKATGPFSHRLIQNGEGLFEMNSPVFPYNTRVNTVQYLLKNNVLCASLPLLMKFSSFIAVFLALVFSACSLLLLQGCKKDHFITDDTAQLEFSTDTVF